MKAEKSLHKLTDYKPKFRELLKLERITKADIDKLSDKDHDDFMICLTQIYNSLKEEDLDAFIKQTEAIISDETKNSMWEDNHLRITIALSTLMQDYGRMPSKHELSKHTGLSRQTIHKHIKSYQNSPLYREQQEQFRFLADKVLAKVFRFAVNGDMGAAKLYFNVLGYLNHNKPAGNTTIENQNNYIQINGLTLSQEKINHLKPEQLALIESILKEAMPQP